MNNFQGVIRNNIHIAAEVSKYGCIRNDTDVQREAAQGFRRKAKSDETKYREASELRYTRRSNICGECHMTRSMTGECDC